MAATAVPVASTSVLPSERRNSSSVSTVVQLSSVHGLGMSKKPNSFMNVPRSGDHQGHAQHDDEQKHHERQRRPPPGRPARAGGLELTGDRREPSAARQPLLGQQNGDMATRVTTASAVAAS